MARTPPRISPSQLRVGDGATAQVRVVNRFEAQAVALPGGSAPPPSSSHQNHDNSDLGDTGSPIAPWLLWLAAALVALGSAFVVGARFWGRD